MSRSLRRITIVGASIAGTRAAAALRRRGFDGALTLIGAESVPVYQRPSLSKTFLTGDQQAADIALSQQDLDADIRLGTRTVQLDVAKRQVWLQEGDRAPYALPYDGLLIACGARARRLPGPPLPGVHTLRSVADADVLRQGLRTGSPRVAVVGAGLIGQEVAATARTLGLEVTLIDPLPLPGAPVLGTGAGRVLADLHREHRTRLCMGCGVAALEGTDRVTGVRLRDGTTVAADVVVVGIGVDPAVEWLIGSGLHLDNGVRCAGKSRCPRGARRHGRR
ncbi:NAD(P)/FAD-dependent oxidoreductase [Streptomyces sp. NBC_00063]|uniref:NAD(P)/FAD-dependent oxidoreductase n=1 Tax=Streptomyces sp. NBC_00063 TaxID=2975638 RepID=UPI003D7394BC